MPPPGSASSKDRLRSAGRWKPTGSASESSASSTTCRSCVAHRSRTSGCPYTTAKTDAYKREVMGDWRAMALARDEAAMAAIHDEFNSRLLRVELPDPKQYQAIVAPFETKLEGFARAMPTAARKDPERQVWQFIGCAGRPRTAVRPDPHGQPGQHQYQPHHGASLRDRRAQGVRRARPDAGGAVPRWRTSC